MWEVVPGLGHILTDSELQNGPGMRNTKRFLSDVFRNFVMTSGKYFNATKELPFIYKEKQIHSVLFPSVEKAADAAFLEQPIKRQMKGQERQGWVDYWVMFNSTVYLIEVKHHWQSGLRQSPRKKTSYLWGQAINQINSISRSEHQNFVSKGESLVKSVILILPSYSGGATKNCLRYQTKEHAKILFDNVISSLNPRPNWSGLWLLHKSLLKPEKFSNRLEIYPSLMFLTYSVSVNT